MIITKQTICDPFTLLCTGDIQQQIGIATIRLKNRKIISIDVYGELSAHAAFPMRKYVLLNLLANKGFHISPIPGALEAFFHLMLFPKDAVTLLGNIHVEDMPDGAEVEFISTIEERCHD